MLLPDLDDSPAELLHFDAEGLVLLVQEHQAGDQQGDRGDDESDGVGLERRVQAVLDQGEALDPADDRGDDGEARVRGGSDAHADGEGLHLILVLLDPGDGASDGVGQPPHQLRDGRLDVVDEVLDRADDGGLKVACGTLDGLGGSGGRDRRLVRAELEDRGVELVSRDLPLLHRVPEVTGIGAHIEQGLLDLPRSTRNSVGKLIKIFRRQLSLPGGLSHNHSDGLESVRISACDSI